MIPFVLYARFRNLVKLKKDIIKNNEFYFKCTAKDFVIKIIETTMADVDKAKGHIYGKMYFPTDKIIEKVEQVNETFVYRYIIPVESEYDMPFSAITTKSGFFSEEDGGRFFREDGWYQGEDLSESEVSYLMDMAWRFLGELDWYKDETMSV